MPKPLLSPAELQALVEDPNRWVQDLVAAEITGIPAASLRRLRFEGKGPRYAKVGNSVRYQIAWLLEFIAARVVETSDTAKAQPPAQPPPVNLPGTYERCLSGHYYAVVRGDEECPTCEQLAELRAEIARLLQKLDSIRAITEIV